MIWDLELIGQVRGLYAEIIMAEELIRSHPEDVQRAAHREVAHALIDMGHPLGVEIDPNDVLCLQLTAQPEHKTRCVVPFRGGWQPQTQEVELADLGEHDGRIVQFVRAGDPLRVALTPRYTATYRAGCDIKPTASVEIVEFTVSGWHETHRRWVYSRAS